MNYQEFSSKIKTKYPQYKDMDDRVLAQKMVSKFPQYKDVAFDSQKKQAPVPNFMEMLQKLSPSNLGRQFGIASANAPGATGAFVGSLPGVGNPGQIMPSIQNIRRDPSQFKRAFNRVNEVGSGSPMTQQEKLPAYAGQAAGTATEFMFPNMSSAAPNKAMVSEAAVPWARRALGFSKRFLKTPFARNTADEAGRVALEEGVIPKLGSVDVMMERAQALKESAGEEMSDAFKNAKGWVETENPLKKAADIKTTTLSPTEMETGSSRLGLNRKALPLKTPMASEGTKIGPLGKLGAETESKVSRMTGREGSTFFEQKAKFIDPKKIISSMEGLRPQFRGGFWDSEHGLIDKAIETVKGVGKGELLTLEQANSIKTKLQSLAEYGTEGYKLMKSLAGKTREIVDTSLDEFGQEIGDSNLSPAFMKAKFKYAAASRMIEGLNNKLSSEMGNMPVSIPSLMMGGAELASGNVPKAVMTMGGTEFLKRRGAGMAARGINELATGASRASQFVPGVANALRSWRKKQNENPNP